MAMATSSQGFIAFIQLKPLALAFCCLLPSTYFSFLYRVSVFNSKIRPLEATLHIFGRRD